MNKLTLHKTYDFTVGEKPEALAIFIHGIAADATSFDGLFEFLKENMERGVRVVAFDLLGTGKSLTSDKLNYDAEEQLEALDNAIQDLDLDLPMIIVGHSMGTMLATRYASEHADKVEQVVLISAPIYRPEDIKDPNFALAMKGFRATMKEKSPELAEGKAFNNEIEYIVSSPENYPTLLKIPCRTTIIFGEKDRIIASFNIPGVLEKNNLISAEKTAGGHGITEEKYEKILETLEKRR